MQNKKKYNNDDEWYHFTNQKKCSDFIQNNEPVLSNKGTKEAITYGK